MFDLLFEQWSPTHCQLLGYAGLCAIEIKEFVYVQGIFVRNTHFSWRAYSILSYPRVVCILYYRQNPFFSRTIHIWSCRRFPVTYNRRRFKSSNCPQIQLPLPSLLITYFPRSSTTNVYGPSHYFSLYNMKCGSHSSVLFGAINSWVWQP